MGTSLGVYELNHECAQILVVFFASLKTFLMS